MGHAVVVANPHPARAKSRTTGQLAQTDTPDPLLQNVPGVGPVLTRVLLAELPAPQGPP